MLRRKILSFIDDNEAVKKGPASHEIHGPDFYSAAQQVVGRGPTPVTAFVAMGKYFQVVHQRAHPGLHLFFLGSRQEADVLSQWHRDAGHDDFPEAIVIQRLGKTSGERE